MTEVFKNFGDITYNTLSHAMSSGIADVAFADDKFGLLGEICRDVLEGQDNYSVILLHNLLFHLTNQNPKGVDGIIIDTFDVYTLKIRGEISELIKTAEFTIGSFIEVYNKYYGNAQHLSKVIEYFDGRVYSDGSNKYSHVGTIRSYMFYKNVINQKYKYIDGREYYIYEIFTKAIEAGNVPIGEILQLFKMYSAYIRRKIS